MDNRMYRRMQDQEEMAERINEQFEEDFWLTFKEDIDYEH